jgi:hypothetical protein
VLLIHAQTLMTLLSFTIWQSAYELSIPKQPVSHKAYCVVCVCAFKHEFIRNAFAIVQGQWEATCNMRCCACGLKMRGHVFRPFRWIKCEVIHLRRSAQLARRTAVETKCVIVPEINKVHCFQITNMCSCICLTCILYYFNKLNLLSS